MCLCVRVMALLRAATYEAIATKACADCMNADIKFGAGPVAPQAISKTPALSSIIVNYNAGTLLRGCVDSLLACPLAVEVIVVDNASHDESFDGLPDSPHIRVIRNSTNVGFAAACNIGIGASSAPFLLFLNPDCFFEPGAVATLLANL